VEQEKEQKQKRKQTKKRTADKQCLSLQAETEQKKKRAQEKKRNKLVKGGKLGRPKKLTPDELRRGVEAYFASITYQEPVMREEFVVLDVDQETGAVTYQLDKMGHRMVRQVPVLGANGKPLMRTVYIEAPGDFGLCNFLKISRDTWDRYGHMLEMLEQATGDGNSHQSPVTRDQGTGDAEGRGPAGLAMTGSEGGATEEELREAREYAEIYTLARGRVCAYLESAAETRGGKGAVFKLERLYGLTEKKEVRVDAGGSIEAYLRGLGDE
jgi:hypothetical protein